MKTQEEIKSGVEGYLTETETHLRNVLKPDNDENEAYIRGYMSGMRKMLGWLLK